MLDFDWIVEGHLLAMAMPWPEEIEDLRAMGVRGVLSLTRRIPEGLPADEIEVLHLPVRDFTAPTLGQIERGVQFIASRLADGGAVAVHCAAGRGRTGTFAAAYLVHEGHDPREAIREVRRRRPGSVETTTQEHVIAEYARRLRGGRSP